MKETISFSSIMFALYILQLAEVDYLANLIICKLFSSFQGRKIPKISRTTSTFHFMPILMFKLRREMICQNFAVKLKFGWSERKPLREKFTPFFHGISPS